MDQNKAGFDVLKSSLDRFTYNTNKKDIFDSSKTHENRKDVCKNLLNEI